MEETTRFTITPVWAVIEHIRKKVQSKLSSNVAQDVVDATLICAIELAENAVKYGESIPSMQYIFFELTHGDKKIEIRCSNGVNNQNDLETVASTIDKINSGVNPEQLYIERLQELMDSDSRQKSQLGLFRIANETGFSLKYEINQNALTIIATREQ